MRVKAIELLTVEQAADLLNLTPHTIRRLLNEGKLPGKKARGGRQWCINREALERYLESYGETETIGDSTYTRESASDSHIMSLMSEAALAQDWLRPEEDEAWEHC